MIPLSHDHTRLKIIDFGLAASISSLSSGATDSDCGTPMYMSPERLSNKPYGPKADIYSAGVVLLELTSGQPKIHLKCSRKEELKKLFQNYSWDKHTKDMPE